MKWGKAEVFEHVVGPECLLQWHPAAHARAVAARAADDAAALDAAMDAYPPGRATAPPHRWRQALVQGGLAMAGTCVARALASRGASPEEAAAVLEALGLAPQSGPEAHLAAVGSSPPGRRRRRARAMTRCSASSSAACSAERRPARIILR